MEKSRFEMIRITRTDNDVKGFIDFVSKFHISKQFHFPSFYFFSLFQFIRNGMMSNVQCSMSNGPMMLDITNILSLSHFQLIN